MKKLGYKNSFSRTILDLLVNMLRHLLLLNFNTTYSNQFSQNLKTHKTIVFEGTKITFRTGHNRLNWRAKSFFDEEPMMISWLEDFVPEDVFFDIGANVGTYTIPALSKGSFVIASELDPINASLLFENVFLNKYFEKFVLLPFGCGQKTKIEKIYYRDFSIGDALQSIGRTNPIPTETNNEFKSDQLIFSIDEIFKMFNLPKPNKVKIDVDGNEKLVFDGGKEIILNSKQIYFEDNGIDDSRIVLDEILSNGFKIENEEKSHRSAETLEMRNLLLIKSN